MYIIWKIHVSAFWRNLLPSALEQKSTKEIEIAVSTETLVPIYQTIWHHDCENRMVKQKNFNIAAMTGVFFFR
jgi:hypothetical protein